MKNIFIYDTSFFIEVLYRLNDEKTFFSFKIAFENLNFKALQVNQVEVEENSKKPNV